MTIPTAALTLDDARAIIRGAFDHAAASGFKPLSVAVLDAGGHLLAFERQDGSSNRRFDIAVGKAHGAISIGVNSRTLGVMAVDRPHFMAGAGNAIGGSLVPVAGGVLVMHEGRAIAAVGISGDTSDNDEAAAMAGIRAAGLSPLE
jgi:uncharacterized protein GlcG (DUF336 family)